MGQNRVELLTPALSERCSNQLSYCPPMAGRFSGKERGAARGRDGGRRAHTCAPAPSLRKEVIQPHLPVRLPCYDFTPVIGITLGSSLLAVRTLTLGTPNSHGVTGGVYKTRERIHPDMLIRDY